ncbi:alpha/beta hydrolase [Pseudomonas sp. P66]|uniref:Alpha/beta hydrolase n=1 Tax=Pseudomonas arcuscaelestis TaxID=2710591 RepID=A0ABS2C056_9PSED|nr:alpha/beta hydrolase [Pseudomonas arcuscaelestis]MBM5459100.1 alpha/beta hydrolase [Pseudomonas arcuscaelestis]
MFKSLIAAGLAAGLSVLSGCASRVDLASYSSSKLQAAVLTTDGFLIQGMVPAAGSYKHMRVYIESDGYAWATSSQPSTDPTPRTSIMLRFAADDVNPSAYLARPCQFVQSNACNTDVWTHSRFGKAEIDSMSSALTALKSRFGVQSFELIGHSGGGEVALVLAGMREDVDLVQTIAGNVDPIFWTKLHNLTPLKTPITPLLYKDRLRTIPQRHIVGMRDRVVPASVAQAYSAQLEGQCLEIVSVDATHNDGYDSVWKRFSTHPLLCEEL